jgi:hypothetical protein
LSWAPNDFAWGSLISERSHFLSIEVKYYALSWVNLE